MAALVGGPEVWTVVESWQQHLPPERTIDNVAVASGLTRADVECAINYYADYRDEIDAEIDSVHQAQEIARLAWERRQAIYA